LGSFLLGFIPSALLAYPIYKTLLAMKSRQTVSQHAPEGHQIKQGTPTMGGLIPLAGILTMSLWRFFSKEGLDATHWWHAAIALSFGFGAIGFVDDYVVPRLIKGSRGLGWKQKIVMQFAFAGLGAWLMLGAVDWRFWITVFVILFYSNAFNFADGLDGLASTLLLAIAGGLLGMSLMQFSDVTTAPLMAGMCGAIIPFLYLNAPPAKVFMGDVGSLPIGALLGAACCSIAFSRPNGDGTLWGFDVDRIVGVKVISIIMAFELIPVPLQIFSVKVFKKKLFPYTPIHHAFEKAGWKETRVVAMFALTQFLLCLLALTLAAKL
jgi:phospho-N-acetylmuramoyl-pentapeptide-transferase